MAVRRTVNPHDRSLATCHPPHYGASLYRDGVYYDNYGRELFTNDHSEEEIPAVIAQWEDADHDEIEVEEPTAETSTPQPKKRGRPRQEPQKPAEDASDQSAENAAVDLIAWAMGRKQYAWFLVRKAFRDQHHRAVARASDAIEFMLDEGLITRDQVGR